MLQRIATGPDLSKPLNEAEAEYGMRLILNGECDPVQAGIFLIALRMKRETPAENRGVLSAIRKTTRTATVAVDDLVDLLADPYNGYAYLAVRAVSASGLERLWRAVRKPWRVQYGAKVWRNTRAGPRGSWD